eukprot:CAMPEP_0194126272 /NCGR_PEP_ID=MMETSP0150-20130528/59900_1 /TAXON_ID=122233 /ORGANISM="Chaetoceros debilis, Strain MM31A-1" /LENGTH=929 /DNA_ID=CAMNT_0038820125 /DNA_START=357 /DNA_END=3147 /DNA_ORIENTATION=-
MEIQQENVKDFHQNDVLCGKGNSVNRHVGNIQLRTIVSELKYEYVATPRKEKQVFSKVIVKKIRSMNPPGRFLMKDESTGLWNDIGDAGPKGAWSKTRMVLREGAPELQKKIDAGEIKVTTNFLAEMDPKEREEMAKKSLHNLKESIMLTPTRDQTSKGDSLNSKGDSLISKSMANSTLNSTSLSLSGGSGMSIQSSENTITSSKMSLMQKSIMSASIMSASSLGSFHSMSIDPKDREEMANEVVRRNRKKGVKKKEKAEHAPKDAPIMVEQTIQPVPFTVPESNEANFLMKVENNLPFNKEHNPNNTPDPATSTMPNAMLPPEPLMMSSSNIQRNSPVQLHKTFNPFNTPDPEISSEPNTMAPPEPITNIKLHRNSLYLSEIDEDFVAVMEGDSDLCYENSEEGYFSELEDDEPAVVGPAAPNGVGASSFMHNLKESIMLTPTRDQTEKRPSLNSKGDSLNSKGDSLISKSMANSTLNSTSLSLSGGSGMSIQSSEYTITSSKMSLMQKSIISGDSLNSKGDSLISKSMANSTLNSTSLSLSVVFGMSIQSSQYTMTSSILSSLMQKSIMSASTLGSFHSMSISETESKAKDQSKNKIEDKNSNASVIPSRIDINRRDYEPSSIFAGNPTSLPESTSGYTKFVQHRDSESSEASHYFRQGQHPRGGPNKVSVTSSDISSRHSSLISGGVSRDNSGRSLHSEYSSLAGYPFMNSFDTNREFQQSLGQQHNTVNRAARMVPPTESFGESFNQGTESFPHNSQSFHHGEGFMSTVTNNNGALFAASSITSNGTASIQGQHISMHNGQSLHRGSGFAPILPTPGVNRVSLTSSTVGQGHVAFGNNGQSFQPGQSIVSNINDGDTTPSEVNRVSIVNQDQLNGSSQINGNQEQAKRRQSYCRTGHIAMPAFNEFDGDEDDEVLAEVLDCFAEG